MARKSKVNRKLVIVVGGFSAAAVLLLGAVLAVNQFWLKNAARNIKAGDELMAQGQYRQAYGMYGRAASKEPAVLSHIAKMEEALLKVTPTSAQQAADDYRTFVGLKRGRVRAQPGDPTQWRMLFDVLEEEADLYPNFDGWLQVEGVARDMLEVAAPGSDAAKAGEEELVLARARRESLLSSGERTDLERRCETFLAANPKSWRAWRALIELRIEDVVRLRATGQEQAAARRQEQLDKAIADMKASVGGMADDASAKLALAEVAFDRMVLDVREGRRVMFTKLDKAALAPASSALKEAAIASARPSAIRAVSTKLLSVGESADANAFVKSWLDAHPDDLVTGGFALELLAAGGDANESYAAIRDRADRILKQPPGTTSLGSSVQAETRSRAIQVLIDSSVVRLAGITADADKAEALKELDALRAQLLEAQQNDATTPMMLATDAKIMQMRGDLAGAAAKWDAYYVRVPQPSADAFVWSTIVARAQNDLGVAMQRATRGAEAFPGDLRIGLQRAELALQLGRTAEAAALYAALAEALPDRPELGRMATELRARAQGAQADKPSELVAIETAVSERDLARARELAAAWMTTSGGALPAVFAQIFVEEQAADKAKALELARAALEKFPGNPDLAKVEAFFATEDPVERIDLMTDRMVSDPQKRALERLRAYRTLRADIARQLEERRRAGSSDLARSEEALARLDAKIPEAEKAAGSMKGEDTTIVEMLFNNSLERKDYAAAEVQIQEAAKMSAAAPALEPLLRSRWLDAQGRTAEAIATLEKARQSGRNEAPIAGMLASLQERVGNEPQALVLWKEAYDRRPNDSTLVRGYARAMGRAGQGRVALELLRAAMEASPADADIARIGAEFEAVYGQRSKAIDIRRKIVELDPIDRVNIIELYALLYAPPDFGSVRDGQGRPRFDTRTWEAVPPAERQRLLRDAAATNVNVAEQVYQASMRDTPLDINFAARKATIMRQMGQNAEATKAIQAVIDAAEAQGKATYTLYSTLAAHLSDIGDRPGSDAAFAKARTLQDPERREVDAILVEVAASRREFGAAADLLKQSFGERPTFANLVRLTDLEVLAKRPDDAAATLARAKSMLGESPGPEVVRSFEMLASAVAASQADKLRDEGKLEESRAKVDESLAALGRAEAATPADLMAPLRRVQLLRALSIGTKDPAKLDQAIAEADRLLARNSLNWQAVSTRADLSLDKRDIRGAIGVLERFLQAQPGSEDAVVRVVALYQAVGDAARAVAAVRSAVDRRPSDPLMAERLGDLLDATGDRAGAASEYERAAVLDPQTLRYLEKAAYTRLRAGNPAEALGLLRGVGDRVTASPVLRAVAAASLMRSNRRDEAIVAAREAVAASRDVKDDGLIEERTSLIVRDMFDPSAEGCRDYEGILAPGGTSSPMGSVLLADAWSRLGPGGAEQALRWCDRVQAGGDAVPAGIRAGAELARGNVLYGRGDLAAACDAFVRSAELNPGNPAALNNAAYLLVSSKGDTTKSFEYASKAVLLAPQNPDYLDTLGFVLLKLNRLAEAEDALSKSVAASPTAAALFHLAQVKLAQGDRAASRQALDRAIAAGPPPDLKKEIDAFAATLADK
jgi:tetratricopeptide (TPR) repeat protein